MADDVTAPGDKIAQLLPRPFDSETELATVAAFAELCRLPVGADAAAEGGRQVVLGRVATLGRMAVPGAAGLSVTIGDPGDPEFLATESAFAQVVDGAQYQAEEGPCVEAFRTASTQHTGDLTTDERWPRLAELAAQTDVRSALAEPIVLSDKVLGVLNAYSAEADALDGQSVEVMRLLAGAVTAVIQTMSDRTAWSRLSEQLQEALASRAEIDQAKGILMAVHRCTADEAFELLKQSSRNTNTKVRDIAARMVDECRQGRVPDVGAG